MGTSKGLPTPRGGGWSRAKRRVNDAMASSGVAGAGDGDSGGNEAADAAGAGDAANAAQSPTANAVAAVMSAMGGLGVGPGRQSGGGRGAGPRRGGSTGGSGGRSPGGQSRRVGRAVAGLGAFGSAVGSRGLTEALRELDLASLEGRPAVEVIARVSERLADGIEGIDAEILKAALNETILEAAQLEQELGYEDLEVGLQSFLRDQGLGGLVELFLAKFVSDLVSAAIFEHIDQRSESASQTEAMLAGIESVCRNKAHTTIQRFQGDGRLNQTDWFGPAGRRLGHELAESILNELRAQ